VKTKVLLSRKGFGKEPMVLADNYLVSILKLSDGKEPIVVPEDNCLVFISMKISDGKEPIVPADNYLVSILKLYQMELDGTQESIITSLLYKFSLSRVSPHRSLPTPLQHFLVPVVGQ
jgi:hypothetical protein